MLCLLRDLKEIQVGVMICCKLGYERNETIQVII